MDSRYIITIEIEGEEVDLTFSREDLEALLEHIEELLAEGGRIKTKAVATLPVRKCPNCGHDGSRSGIFEKCVYSSIEVQKYIGSSEAQEVWL